MSTSQGVLELVNLSSQDDFDEMIRQRKICGWKYSTEIVKQWRNRMENGTQLMWWIMVPSDDNDNNRQSPNLARYQKAGHISLSSELSSPEPDPDLARADRSILHISTFFILPACRKSGLGRIAMMAVEERASQIPECRQVTVDTMDRRYFTNDSPEWGGQLAMRGNSTADRHLIVEDWYVRMGYERFKSSHVFAPTWNGTLKLSCLRKQVK